MLEADSRKVRSGVLDSSTGVGTVIIKKLQFLIDFGLEVKLKNLLSENFSVSISFEESIPLESWLTLKLSISNPTVFLIFPNF